MQFLVCCLLLVSQTPNQANTTTAPTHRTAKTTTNIVNHYQPLIGVSWLFSHSTAPKKVFVNPCGCWGWLTISAELFIVHHLSAGHQEQRDFSHNSGRRPLRERGPPNPTHSSIWLASWLSTLHPMRWYQMPNLTPNLAWFADQIPFVWQLTIAAMFDSDSVQFKLHSGRNAQRLNTQILLHQLILL